MSRSSDRRLERLVRMALYALEDPAAGFVFDDFDIRYREAERLREKKSAEWFYRDKTPFETKYGDDCERNGGNEPAWVSDAGRGAFETETIVSYLLDGEEDPFWLRLWRKRRSELKPRHRAVHDALAVDWRSAIAARIAGSSRPTVNLCKKIFKVHFAQCLRAWERDFGV